MPGAHALLRQELRRMLCCRSGFKCIHEKSRGTYGRPRIHASLRLEGTHVSGKRIARLMRLAALVGVSRRKQPGQRATRKETRPAPDLVHRQFSATGPNKLWVADITYVPTWSGWLYLAVVLDAWSRRVVGWAMASASEKRGGGGRTDDGSEAASARSGDPSLRSGSSIYIDSVWAALQGGRGQTVDGVSWGLL